jgi:hypothetical protein
MISDALWKAENHSVHPRTWKSFEVCLICTKNQISMLNPYPYNAKVHKIQKIHSIEHSIEKSPSDVDSSKSHICHIRKRSWTEIQIIQFTPNTSIHDRNIYTHVSRNSLSLSRRSNFFQTKGIGVWVRAYLLRIYPPQSQKRHSEGRGELNTEEFMRDGTDQVC